MKILKIAGKDLTEDQKKEISDFCVGTDFGSIHQTAEWGEFQMTHPGRKKFWVVMAYEKETLVGSAVLIRSELPMGKMALICPRGPVLKAFDKKVFDGILKGCGDLAQKNNAVYVRFEWPFEKGRVRSNGDFERDDNFEQINGWLAGMKKAHSVHQPEHSLVVDITGSEDEILKQMKQKGRYNTRLAKKKGVQVTTGKTADNVERFFELVLTTTKRNHFSGHGKNYYKNMLEKLGEQSEIFLAEYEGEIIAGIIVTFFGDEAIYYYGASGNKHRNLMAPYLLQWEAILEAKKRGCKKYDFFGIAPRGVKNHSWKKITGFKKKFGGEEVDYFDAREMVVQPFWYWAMILMKKLRGLLSKLLKR